MRFLLYISVLFLLGCGAQKEVSKVETNPKPEWTNDRPINSSYYTGIGSASKILHSTDYTIVAKKNALSDMSSEIKIKLTGETFYQTIDNNYAYSEEFQSMVRTTFEEEISDYEIIDTWENESEFWIYTRISKAKHKQIKLEKKNAILDQAYGDFNLAKDFNSAGKTADALDLLGNALLSMKEYWAESNIYLSDNGEISLDKEIYNLFRSTCSNLSLKTSLEEVNLNYSNGFYESVSVLISDGNQYLANIPVEYKFTFQRYTRPKTIYTNTNGVASVYIENENDGSSSYQLEIGINYDELIHNKENSEMSEMLLNSINKNKISIPVYTVMPTVYVHENVQLSAITKVVKNELQLSGFTITSNPENADLEMTLLGDFKPGGMTQGFQLSLLEFNVILEDHKSLRQVFSDSYTNIKGIHMNLAGAEGDAVKNATKKVKKELMPKLLKVIM